MCKLILEQDRMLSETISHFVSNETTNYFNTLKADDKKLMLYVKDQYRKMSADALMKHLFKLSIHCNK